ncbi:hypothetical protein G6F46_015683 [Rhizopus delemar]|nr:hypothetical protein G6F46_015683 [Rhizopus delemar]
MEDAEIVGMSTLRVELPPMVNLQVSASILPVKLTVASAALAEAIAPRESAADSAIAIVFMGMNSCCEWFLVFKPRCAGA